MQKRLSCGGGGQMQDKSIEGGRVKKSARNFAFTVFQNMLAILAGLVAQRLFLKILGLEYAGLNGLFSNVITMLSIADLGIGEAVIFHLYKPLREKDQSTVLSLMRFYKRAFRAVACIIAAVGVCLIPALPLLVQSAQVGADLTLIYLIFLADAVLSYLLSYKRAILYADQRNYLISAVHMAYLIGMNTFQILMLYATRNYYAYLGIKVLFRVLENLVIAAVADRLYPYLKGKDVRPLHQEILKDIRKKTGALVFHKIGMFAVNGTDNLLISVFFTISTAGLYNNYYIVFDAASKVFRLALSALTPSVGNLLVSGDREHLFQTFRRIRFMNFWIASFSGTGLLILIQPFVRLWFGEGYLMQPSVVVLLVIQFFQALMRASYHVFQDAAGIFYENRFVPLLESFLNLAASVVLLKLFGLPGVFAGTIVSSLALWAFSFPRFIYKGLFHRGMRDYTLETCGYLLLFLAVAAASALAAGGMHRLVVSDGIGQFVVDILLCLILPNSLLFLAFRKSDCFQYFLLLLKRRTS